MTFDQLIDAWQAQDATALGVVDRDLLHVVLTQEQADLQRTARLERLTAYAAGAATIAVAGGVIWWLRRFDGTAGNLLLALVALAAAIGWVVALWLDRRRQAARERGFGNNVEAEVRRNLSHIDHRLSVGGRLGAALLWSAPVTLAVSLLLWLLSVVNRNESQFFDLSLIAFVLLSAGWTAWEGSRKLQQQLAPRRQRLADLLALLTRN